MTNPAGKRPPLKLTEVLETGHKTLTDLAPLATSKLKEHPGELEGLIPVWGPGREAIADAFDGDYLGAIGNGALAVADLSGGAAITRSALRGAIIRPISKATGKTQTHAWSRMREDMGKSENGKAQLLEKGQHGHHWLIPHKEGLGKFVPNVIKNQPWNITPMPSAEVHGRIHGRYKGKPRFNPAERIWYGTPRWSKVAAGGGGAHGMSSAKSAAERNDD